MKFKCHYCAQNLVPGSRVTLECKCGECKLSFSKDGAVSFGEFNFFDKGRDFKLVFLDGKLFLFKKPLNKLESNNHYKSMIQEMAQDPVVYTISSRYYAWMFLIKIDNIELKFTEDGSPDVYRLLEKLHKFYHFK